MKCNSDDCISRSSFFVTFVFLSMMKDGTLIVASCDCRTRTRFRYEIPYLIAFLGLLS